jgi:hypothetical protein
MLTVRTFVFRSLALLLLALFVEPFLKPMAGQTIFACNQSNTQWYIEELCIIVHTASSCDRLNKVCEFHRCRSGVCTGYIYDCVVLANACMYDGCLDCPCL